MDDAGGVGEEREAAVACHGNFVWRLNLLVDDLPLALIGVAAQLEAHDRGWLRAHPRLVVHQASMAVRVWAEKASRASSKARCSRRATPCSTRVSRMKLRVRCSAACGVGGRGGMGGVAHAAADKSSPRAAIQKRTPRCSVPHAEVPSRASGTLLDAVPYLLRGAYVRRRVRRPACEREVPTAVREALSGPPQDISSQPTQHLSGQPTENLYGNIPTWGNPYGLQGPPPQQAPDVLKHAGEAIAHIWADVRSFNFKWIVPYETALSTKILQNPSTWVMPLFGFFPLLGFMLVSSIEQLLICLVGICARLGGLLLRVRRQSHHRSPHRRRVVAFTIFIGVSLVLILQALPPLSFFYGLTRSETGLETRLLGFICGVGFNEELMKALPALLLALRLGPPRSRSTASSTAPCPGLGFAIPEGYMYITHSANVGALLRPDPPAHHDAAVSARHLGCHQWLLHRPCHDQQTSPRRPLALGVAVAATLHGLYDFFSGGGTAISARPCRLRLPALHLIRGPQPGHGPRAGKGRSHGRCRRSRHERHAPAPSATQRRPARLRAPPPVKAPDTRKIIED